MKKQSNEEELRNDSNWVVFKGRWGLMPFHRQNSVTMVIENEAQNRRLCDMLVALGRPTIEEIPPNIVVPIGAPRQK
jgi:hypothetical protein